MMKLELTSPEVEIVAFAVKQVFLFDGFDEANDDHHHVANVLVKMGFKDPREA